MIHKFGTILLDMKVAMAMRVNKGKLVRARAALLCEINLFAERCSLRSRRRVLKYQLSLGREGRVGS